MIAKGRCEAVAPELERYQADWLRLEAEAGVTPFQTWAWARTWWRHFGHGGEPLVLAAGSPPRSLLPLVVWTVGPVRVLRLLGQDRFGYGPGDYLGQVGGGASPELAAELGRSVARAPLRYDLLSFTGLSMETGALRAFCRELGMPWWSGPPEVCRSIDATVSWERFLASRSKSFRKTVARAARKVASLGRSRVEAERPSPALLAEMADVDRASWKWDGGQSFFRDVRLRAFLEELLLASVLASEVWTCRIDGRLAAYDVSLLGGATRYSWLTAYRRDRPGAGSYLLAEITRATLASDSYAALDLMQGDDPYKARWAGRARAVHRLVAGHGAVGRPATVAARLRWRLLGSRRMRQARVAAQRWWRSTAERRRAS